MPKVSTNKEEVIRLKVIEIGKLQANLVVLPGYNLDKTTTMALPPIGTSLTKEIAIGNTGDSVDNATIIPTTALQA